MLLMDVTSEDSIYRACWIWFAEAPFHPAGYERVYFMQARLETSTDLFSPAPFDTLCSDLTLSKHEMWARLNKGKKSNIAIARREAWLIEIGHEDADIQRFHVAQTGFARDKQIGEPWPLKLLCRNASHCLAAFVHNRNGDLICWNFYVLAKPIVRLWHAGSDLTYPKSSDRGYAAAFLHWEMMLYFKQEGYETYDWGGVVLDTNSPVYSITRFKASFGGKPARHFHYWCDFGVSPRTALWRKMIRRLGNLNLRAQ
jgi:hypothetical protein